MICMLQRKAGACQLAILASPRRHPASPHAHIKLAIFQVRDNRLWPEWRESKVPLGPGYDSSWGPSFSCGYPFQLQPTQPYRLLRENISQDVRARIRASQVAAMCRILRLRYECGHDSPQGTAPCAGRNYGGCKGLKVNDVRRPEHCPRCGEWVLQRVCGIWGPRKLDWRSPSRGYRCKKSRRDCSKRKRPHNPTQFSLKPKGMRRGGTRGFNSSNIHSGVTVDTSLGKGCRLYQCWIRLETERCSSYKSFHSVEDDNLRPWISSTETEDACKDICLAKSFAPGAPGSGKERTWTRSWQGIRG